MGDLTFLLWAGPVALLALIGIAGFVFDRVRGPAQPSRDQEAKAQQTLRYYRDVGDSNNTTNG